MSEAQSDPLTAEPSRSTRNKLWLTARRSGWTPLSTPNQNCYSKLSCLAAVGLTDPARRSSVGSLKHDDADRVFLVDAGGYLTALSRHDLSGRPDYRPRNHIEKCFQTVTMRIDRFHSFWRGSQSSAKQWLRRSRHHYNHGRPDQALDGKEQAEVIQNHINIYALLRRKWYHELAADR